MQCGTQGMITGKNPYLHKLQKSRTYASMYHMLRTDIYAGTFYRNISFDVP